MQHLKLLQLWRRLSLLNLLGVHNGDRLLDVGCGTGVVALTAAQVGAKVSGSDLTPELIIRAKENAQISNLNIDFQVADVEDLPYKDNEFDFVLSQFGHMFAPRPESSFERDVKSFKTWRNLLPFPHGLQNY